MNVGENIRAIRTAQSLTLEQVGKSLGVSKQFVSQLEKGLRTLNLSQLLEICDILRCTPNDILKTERKDNHE